TPDSFNAERFKAPDVLDLIGRTTVEVLDEFTAAAPGVRNCRLVATARDGRIVTAQLGWTLADNPRGLSDEEVEDKFAKLTRDLLTPPRRRQLLDLLWRLETVPDITQLVDLLAI